MRLAMKWTSSVLVLVSLFALPQAQAQNTTGNSVTGGNLWSSKGCGPGCHLPSAKPVNAANAGGHISYSITQMMPASSAVSVAEANDIAAYLAGFAPDPNPANVSIPFNTGTAIPLPNIYVNSTYGKFTSLQTVTGPTRGSVVYSYVGNNATATYTPTTGQTGTDSFSYQGVVAGGCSGGCSSNRTVTVNILPPSFQLTILKPGTGTGKVVSSPAGINCSPSCVANFPPNTIVTLTATADPGSALIDLNSQPSNTTQITLTSNTTINATFNIAPNDNFVDRIVFVPTVSPGSSYAYIRRFNATATKEPGEPSHAGNTGGASLWYSWTAPFTGSVNIVTGSSANLFYSDFNTLLAVYTGNAVNALTLVAANDDVNPANSPPNIKNLLSSVTFQAIAGTTYQIAVDGSNTTGTAETGKIDLTIIQPGNDLFAARLALSGSSVTVTDNNTAAYGTDSGEPLHAGIAGGKSLWWSWMAPISGTVNINTAGSDFNTLVGVYTGTAVNALTPVASNDNVTPGINLTSAVSFNATAGTTYQIAVDGFNGATGNITLNIVQQPPLAVTAVVSRKTHGTAVARDRVLVNRLLPITGTIDIEPRMIGTGHRIVFQMNRAVTSPGAVAVTTVGGAPIGAATATAAGNEVIVTLTNIADGRRTLVSLTNINGEGLSASATVGFMVGDVSNSRAVNASDISAVKGRAGPVTGANFLFDLDASGTVGPADVSAVKARSGMVLP